MGGFGVRVAKTTHFGFYVSINTSNGFQYRGFSITKYKPKKDEYGNDEAEWLLEPTAWTLSEDEQSKLREAIKELELEKDAAFGFAQLTEQQITLSEMWKRMQEAELMNKSLRHRLENAESTLSKLFSLWDELEKRDDKKGEANETEM